jgi:hypothetical protein
MTKDEVEKRMNEHIREYKETKEKYKDDPGILAQINKHHILTMKYFIKKIELLEV